MGTRRSLMVRAGAASCCVIPAGCFAVIVVINGRLESIGRGDLGQLGRDSLPPMLAMVSATVVGAILAVRRPSHPVGWLFLALGSLIGLAGFADEYAAYVLVAHAQDWPGARQVAVISDAIWLPWFFVVSLVLHLTPTGRPVSRRWGLVAWSSSVVTVLAFAFALLRHHTLNSPFEAVHNPWALNDPHHIVAALSGLLAMGAGVGVILAGVSLFVRFRRAQGVERRQLLWLAGIAAALPVLVAASFVAATTDQQGVLVVATAGFILLIPVAAGLSISRYHLYDVDRILSRAATYGLLTLLLAGVYVLVVVVASHTLGQRSGHSQIAAVVATLVSVSVAFPAYRRLQDGIDRRFNRRRYEAVTAVRTALRGDPADFEIEAVMRTAVGDANLRVALWLAEDARWVTSHGEVAQIRDGEVLVSRRNRPVASLSYDRKAVDQGVMQAVASEAAGELETLGLRASVERRLIEVTQSRERIVEAQLIERRRLERNLHDGVQQRLLAVAFRLRAMQLRIDSDANASDLEDAIGEVRGTLDDLRELANGLRPAVLDDLGLAAALEGLARRSPVPVELDVTDERFAATVEEAAWFIACEALTNAVKHSEATTIYLSARRVGPILQIVVEDDGLGGADPDGTGIRGLIDRAEAARGWATVRDRAPSGTSLTTEIPCGS